MENYTKMKFTEYLTESKENKNVHLEHLEEEPLNRGVAGARDAINFLRSLRDMLAGHTDTKVNVTTKWDGAPAVFCGINPENNKFFVGTKGVFAKNAKLNYTDKDIDANHPAEGLNKKLKVALRYLPKLGIKGVLQGDMMFTKGDLKNETIDGADYITFQPNTIVYAVPSDSKLAQMMLSAQVGIVFHTSYTGKTFSDMKASFNIDINRLASTKDVWFRDAYFVDASGTATFTEQETKNINYILSDLGNLFRGINPVVLNRIGSSETILTQIKAFNNSKVRAGQVITDTTRHVRELIKTIEVYSDQGPINYLNELEYIEGLVYANIWMSNSIAVIDPLSGKIMAIINADELVSLQKQGLNGNVLNGIAYNSTNKKLYLTGKYWSKLFEVQISK